MERNPRDDERLWMLAFGLTLVTMPAVTLVLAFAVLSATQSAVVEQLTLALFAFVLYRIARYTWDRQVSVTTEDVPPESETPTNVESQNREESA